MNDADLNTLFDGARAAPPAVPQDLVDRVMADAAAVQAGKPQAAGWRQWLRMLGGPAGLGGLITATCVGFWIGVAPPEGLPDLAGLVLGQEFVSATEADTDASLFGWDVEEG